MSLKAKKAQKAQDPNRLTFKHFMLWKSSDISQAWVSVIMLNFLSLYASDTLGINIGLVGTLLLVSKIIDAITDIFAGWLIDNTHTRWGKGRPYELCILGMTTCTILLFCCDPKWSLTLKCAWILLMYALVFSVFSTLRGAAGTAYTIRHFSNNQTVITKVTSYGGIVAIAAAMIVNVAFPVMIAKLGAHTGGWTIAAAAFMVPGSLIGVLRFFTCKEDPSIDAGTTQKPVRIHEIFEMFRKNKYVWIFAVIMLCYNISTNLAVGSYFFKWVIGSTSLMGITSVFSVILLPVMFFFPAIIKKFGTMSRMISCFCFVGIAGFVICFLSGSFLPGVLFGFLLGSFANLPLAYYGILFIMDCCTYNEMIGLPRMDGSSSILSNFMSKFGAALGSWITGLLLMAAGYVSAAGVTSQPASALLMIRIDYSLVPAALLVITAFCCMAFSKLEKMIPAWKAEHSQAAATAAKTPQDIQDSPSVS